MRWQVGLALYAGLRCAEIAALRGEDVWRTGDRTAVVVRHGKGGKDRVVPMAAELAAILRDAPTHGPLFPGRGGDPVHARAVSSRLRRHLLRCGVDATAHQLRHTFATTFAQRSPDLYLLMRLMGHSSPSTTIGYIQLAAGQGRDVIDGLYGPAPL
jgi:integrase